MVSIAEVEVERSECSSTSSRGVMVVQKETNFFHNQKLGDRQLSVYSGESCPDNNF